MPDRKLLQEVQKNRGWLEVELFKEKYIKSLNLTGTIRKTNEFDTIWERAWNEGGEYHINQFFKAIFDEANKL